MALFDIPNRPGKKSDIDIAKKANAKSRQSVTTVRGGNSLIERINAIKAMVDKSLGHLKDKYIIIKDIQTLVSYIDVCVQNGHISIDTETTGLDPMQDQIAGICIYTEGQKGAYIPLNHVSYITNMPVPDQLPIHLVKEQFERITKDIFVVMFNAKFDIRFLRNQVGVKDIHCDWDCYLAARLLNENEGSGNNGLKKLHQKYVLKGEGDAFKFDDLFKGIPFNMIPINVGYLYAAHDPEITWELYKYQQPYLTADNEECIKRELTDVAWVFHNIEMPCVQVVCDMEDAGIELDMGYANELSEKYNELLQDVTNEFYDICDKYSDDIDEYKAKTTNHKLDNPINIGSSTQIGILLYDILKIEPPDLKNPRGTGVDILSKIDNDVTRVVLKYREISKLLSTYIDKLPTCVNPNDGRIHCSFNQYGADTGRFSSSDPNLQNIPSHNKDIRKMFKATDGYVLMSSDYSQQEPKVMTQMCGDESMIKAYQEGKDLYAEIASLSFNTTYDNCLEFRPDGTTNKEGKERRSQAKSILLGVLYGRGVPSIAEQLGTSTDRAQAIKDSVFKGFPAIPRFERDSLDMAYEKGYVTTLWGRKRRLPDLQLNEFEFKWKDGVAVDSDPLNFDENVTDDVPENRISYYLRKLKNARFGQKRKIFEEANKEGIWIVDNGAKIADAQRQCVNARIQGSAADMSKLAMIKVGTDERLKELGFRLLIPVHDELIAECPKENMQECEERFAQLMSEAASAKLTIPISCDVEITERWYGESIVTGQEHKERESKTSHQMDAEMRG